MTELARHLLRLMLSTWARARFLQILLQILVVLEMNSRSLKQLHS